MDRLRLLLASVTLGAGVADVGVAGASVPVEKTQRLLSIEGPVRLPARLNLPSGPGTFPGVVLVHGSGPADKDGRMGEHRPFLDLARGLARRGVAVLTYDKRTHVNPGAPIRTVSDEVIDDARAALRLLSAQREIAPGRVFVLGYDLGAYLVPRIASGQAVAGAILLGGAARPLWELHPEQVRRMLEDDGGLSPEDRRQLKIEQDAARRIQKGPLRPGDEVTILGRPTPATYWLDLRPYDAVRAARALEPPLLLLFGERDEFVTARDRELWRRGLKGRPVTFKSYPDLNHLFRAATPQGEIADLDRAAPLSESVIADIAEWIRQQPGPGGRR
jgi:uncharacterized protein